MPKSMKKRCDFGTCDFSIFAKSITFKTFFLHDPGHQKSNKNRCKIDAGKRRALIMTNLAKMEPKREPKSDKNMKNVEKRHPGNQCKKNVAKIMPSGA